MPATAPASDRYARRVRRARLSVPRDAPARRLAFAMEESLRLTTLPGENEGRSYYFRRLRIRNLPPDGDRRRWLEAFQSTLLEAASSAVHAAHPRASDASAVYFQGETEALEILLHRLIGGRQAPEWFWPAVLERELAFEAAPEAAASARSLVPQIIERLRARESSWIAVAIAVFAAPQALDVIHLLAAIPPETARRWLAEMEAPAQQAAQTSGPAHADHFRSPAPAVKHALARAVETFGSEDVRTLWLATVAVLFETPAALSRATAVSQARQFLHRRPDSNGEDQEQGSCAGDAKRAPAFAAKSTEREGISPQDEDESEQPRPASKSREEQRAYRESDTERTPQALTAGPARDTEDTPQARRASPYHIEGAPTTAGGLFFLLNILHRLGISEGAPTLAIPILHRLATQAGVPADDPVAVWLAGIALPASAVQIRAWGLAVHRYIRLLPIHAHESPLTTGEIVNRPGIFTVNRADLDITLPLDAAEIRIRRAGLDLDPGWLPWFGRVVRFHYVLREEFLGHRV